MHFIQLEHPDCLTRALGIGVSILLGHESRTDSAHFYEVLGTKILDRHLGVLRLQAINQPGSLPDWKGHPKIYAHAAPVT